MIESTDEVLTQLSKKMKATLRDLHETHPDYRFSMDVWCVSRSMYEKMKTRFSITAYRKDPPLKGAPYRLTIEECGTTPEEAKEKVALEIAQEIISPE